MTKLGRTTRNGYDGPHKRLRAQVARTVEAGAAVCWRCRRPIHPREPWDLGHADGPGAKILRAYRGPEHRACNRIAGGHARWHRRPPVGIPQPRPRALQFFD
jgi:hypothetical protein